MKNLASHDVEKLGENTLNDIRNFAGRAADSDKVMAAAKEIAKDYGESGKRFSHADMMILGMAITMLGLRGLQHEAEQAGVSLEFKPVAHSPAGNA